MDKKRILFRHFKSAGKIEYKLEYLFKPRRKVPPPDATAKDIVGNWEEFEKTFHPLTHEDLGEGYDDFFDNDLLITLDTIAEIDPAHVWTVVDGDDGELYLAEGFHLVNRLGYVVARAPRAVDDPTKNLYKVYSYSK